MWKSSSAAAPKNAVRVKIEKSVKGVCAPHTLLAAPSRYRNLLVGAEHTHAAQQPEVLDISDFV